MGGGADVQAGERVRGKGVGFGPLEGWAGLTPGGIGSCPGRLVGPPANPCSAGRRLELGIPLGTPMPCEAPETLGPASMSPGG